jgi:hypothetical protein
MHRIDSCSDVDMEDADGDNSGDDSGVPAASNKWPWEAVRNKLVEALTEMTVLTDVISIATKDCGKDAQVPGLPDFSWYNIPKREKYTK